MSMKLLGLRSGVILAALALVAGVAPATAQQKRNPWVGAWGYAASPAVETPAPTRPAGTFRYRVRLTQSGAGVAVRLTNPENSLPLVIASVSVAPAAATGFATAAPEIPAMFGGQRQTRVEAGASRSTDPLRLALKAGGDIVITIVTAAPSSEVSGNAGFRTQFTPAGESATTMSKSRPLVSLVSIHNPQAPCTIVTLGDSITEGARGTEAYWRGWPGRLAQRLIAAAPARHCGVVNMGISGNRLLTYGRGPSAIDRFGRDVLAVPGVTHVILLEGINDIARSAVPRERKIAAADLIAGYRKIIEMGRKNGLRVIGATMTPAWGSRFNNVELEKVRREANQWIREPGNFDGVIDFEAALADGSTPPAMKPDYDSGDKLHPGEAGFDAMAAVIPLTLFATPAKASSK